MTRRGSGHRGEAHVPGDSPGSAVLARREVGQLVGQLSSEDLGARDRGRLLLRLSRALTAGVRTAGTRAALSGRFLVDAVTDLAPHLPVRDLPTLREHYDGLSGDELALALVRSASRVTAASSTGARPRASARRSYGTCTAGSARPPVAAGRRRTDRRRMDRRHGTSARDLSSRIGACLLE